jgi:hypothetical protein
LLSLPKFFLENEEFFVEPIQFKIDLKNDQKWRNNLPKDKFKIGICWEGNAEHKDDKRGLKFSRSYSLENLKFLKNYTILEKNIYEDNFFLNLNMNFDLIFLDPPYKDKNLDKLLLKIIDGKILNKNGIIVLHRHKKEADIIPLSLKILEEKKYGISKITFLSVLN